MPKPKRLPVLQLLPVAWTVEQASPWLDCRLEGDRSGRLYRFEVFVFADGMLRFAPSRKDEEFVYRLYDADGAQVARLEWEFPDHVDDLTDEDRKMVESVCPGPFQTKDEAERLEREADARDRGEDKHDDDGDV